MKKNIGQFLIGIVSAVLAIILGVEVFAFPQIYETTFSLTLAAFACGLNTWSALYNICVGLTGHV